MRVGRGQERPGQWSRLKLQGGLREYPRWSPHALMGMSAGLMVGLSACQSASHLPEAPAETDAATAQHAAQPSLLGMERHSNPPPRDEMAESAQGSKVLSTYVVSNTNDSGAGSLRQAIIDSNNNVTTDTITFNIPGSGVKVIQPQSALPAIAGKITIDGCSQPGASCTAWPPTLQIELDVSVAGRGLTLLGGSSLVRGLSIYGSTYTSTLDAAEAISLRTKGSNKLQTNYIGVRADGITAVQNSIGIYVTDLSGANVIGSDLNGVADDVERNLISGNLTGLYINDSGGSNLVQRNYVGVDATGTAAVPNRLSGILTDSDPGSNQYIQNVISGNTPSGLWLKFVSNELVQNNIIGAAVNGTSAIPNNGPGIRLQETNRVVIGGTTTSNSSGGNVIANNIGSGVQLDDGSGLGNRFSYNTIHNNKGIGIDLLPPAGANANDATDSDTGVNDLQNSPEIGTVGFSGEQLTITYRVMCDPAQVIFPLNIDFYVADSDAEEGKTYIGSDTYLESRARTLTTATFVPAVSVSSGSRIVAIATDRNNNASEFTPKDADGDGSSWPSDCNDANPAIKPGAAEIAGDGVDQNCDGKETCYKDADSDGYRPNTTATVVSNDASCADPGEATAAAPTTDCDDTVGSTYPGASESCDTVDSDCDGSLVDGFPDSENDAVPDCVDTDDDGDQIPDASDNCPLVSNASQADTDGNGKGDACEQDQDGDNYSDSLDNCPTIKNADQADLDKDGVGDVCDLDQDGDGANAGNDCNDRDKTLTTLRRYYRDIDQDGIGDTGDYVEVCSLTAPSGYVSTSGDNCPDVSNADQGDLDRDQIGDACDTDKDGDLVSAGQDCDDEDASLQHEIRYYADPDADGYGSPQTYQDVCSKTAPSGYVSNGTDNCPDDGNPGQADLDKDGVGDVCDPDQDGDGRIDEEDCAPTNPSLSVPLQCYVDAEGDGLGSGSPNDVCAASCPINSTTVSGDNCPDLENTDQANLDGDALGDVCDDDVDGDGHVSGDDCNDRDASLSTVITVYSDGDEDGYGNSDESQEVCALSAPVGTSTQGGDNCPEQYNPEQQDSDDDGVGDACEEVATPTPSPSPTAPAETPSSTPTSTPGLTPTDTPPGTPTEPPATGTPEPTPGTPTATPGGTTPGTPTSTPDITPTEPPVTAVILAGGGCTCSQSLAEEGPLTAGGRRSYPGSGAAAALGALSLGLLLRRRNRLPLR